MTRNTDDISFEEALSQLESITEKLKEGKISLKESLELYDQGVNYYKVCSNILDHANQKIQIYNKELNSFKEADN